MSPYFSTLYVQYITILWSRPTNLHKCVYCLCYKIRPAGANNNTHTKKAKHQTFYEAFKLGLLTKPKSYAY